MEFSYYLDGDEAGIVDLLVEVFGRWPNFDIPVSPLKHWKWKYLDSPTQGIVSLAMDGDKIIGCSHMIMKKIKVGPKIYFSGVGADAAVHKDYEGKGIYSRIGKARDKKEVLEGLKFRTSVSNHWKLIRRNFRRGNYLFPNKVVELNKIEDINLHYKDRILYRKLGFHILSIGNKLSNIFYSKQASQDVEVHELKKFDESINGFWERVGRQYNCIIVRDEEYLNWRYCDPRGGLFRILEAKNGESTIGFIVLRINSIDEEYPVGYIVDYLVDPNQPSTLYSLLSCSMEYFKENNVNLVRSWSIVNNACSHFSRLGFLVNPKKLHVFISKESIIDDELHWISRSEPEKIFFALGDHDHI
jgi:hypothetical protein